VFVAEAMSLPKTHRSQLADKLIARLGDDVEISPAWSAELHRRAREIDDGTATLLEHDEVMRQARELIARGRSK
jgi:putative addiction module component (TIGR02574 family)